jgi:muramoyltetrapeptide carboxypeptidase
MFKALKAGDKVAVVAPAGCLPPERLAIGLKMLTDAGLVPEVAEQGREVHGRFAGDDAARAADMMAAYKNRDIKAIFCAKGGYGSSRILDLLDYEVIKANPKPLIGYSDITALHIAIWQRTGNIGLHARSLGDCTLHYANPDADAELMRFLQGEVTELGLLANTAPEVVVAGEAEGTLIGGNIRMLSHLCGTPDQPHTEDSILFLEEVGEERYSFDRLLLQMQRAGLFRKLKGVVLGSFHKVTDTSPPEFGLSTQEIIERYFTPLNIPLVRHWPTGHTGLNCVMPIGQRVQLTAAPARIILKILR